MEATNLRKHLVNSINTLPTDMLEELNKFISFLEYKNITQSIKEESIDPYFYKRQERLTQLRNDIQSGEMPMHDFDSSMDALIKELES